MAGPYEQKLDRATNAQPVVIMQAADIWKAAADGLGKVAEQIDSAKRSIADSWQGDDATAATAAFSSLSQNVRTNQRKMQSAGTALDTAGQTLMTAQGDYNTLPPAGVAPGPLRPGPDGTTTHEARIEHAQAVASASAADAAREEAAKQAYHSLESGLRDSQITMTAAAPPVYDSTGGGGRTPTGSGPGTTSGGTSGPGQTVGTTGGGPVGPYATSTGGTHVHAEVVGPGGHVIGFDPLVHPVAGWHPGTTADGVVDGSLGPLGGTIGNPALGLPGGSTPGALAGSSPGGLAGGAVGGLAGVLGGAGGALGALRGGATSAASAGSALAGRLGAVGGVAEVPGSTTPALGGATRGSLGTVGRGGVLGATPGSSTTAGTTGGTGTTGRTSMAPGGGTTGGRTAGGTSGRSTSGRYASAAAEVEAAAGRGGRTSTGLRSGGRSGAVSDGATGRGSGSGKDEKAAKRKSMVFEDDDAWLDEDESGPDVIR